MKAYLRQLLLLGALTVLGFVLYALLFCLGVGADITILFYRGVVLAILVSLLMGAAATWLGRRLNDPSLPIAAASLTLSFNVCFLVLLPVTVDRSVTVYLLSTIERQQHVGIDASGLQRSFINGYVVQMGAINRRIDEQRKSGNIILTSDGKIRLTPQGHRFMVLSRTIARLFGTDPRFVEGSTEPSRPTRVAAVLHER